MLPAGRSFGAERNMKRTLPIVMYVLAGASLVWGATSVYRISTGGGGGDGGVSDWCRILAWIYVLIALILIILWGRCVSGCETDIRPESCRANCAALYGGALIAISVLIYFLCVPHTPSPPSF
jgi:hypothetical protein